MQGGGVASSRCYLLVGAQRPLPPLSWCSFIKTCPLPCQWDKGYMIGLPGAHQQVGWRAHTASYTATSAWSYFLVSSRVDFHFFVCMCVSANTLACTRVVRVSVCVCVCPCVTCTYMKCSDSARCFPQLLCTLFSEMGVSPELPPVIEGYECALCMWVSGSELACLCLYSKCFSAELSSHPEVPLLGALISTFLFLI